METRQLTAGAVGGIAGGIVFGAMMQMEGMLGMVAGLIGADGVAAGWAVHLVISVLIGLGFGAAFGGLARSWAAGTGLSLGYGAVWWVLGPLLIMPAWMGMPLLQINEMTLMSLVGHLAYGLVLGLVFVAFTTKVASAAGQHRDPARSG